MTDFWVSQAKHYCEYCNSWIQGDKVSIKRHESDSRHLNRVQNFFKRKRKEKETASLQERQLQKQLQDIEKAAQQRFTQDQKPPPPPPRRQRAPPPPVRSKPQAPSLPPPSTLPPPPPPPTQPPSRPPPPQVEGAYTIRGRTYLEGQHHEDKLITGCQCEVWVEQLEDWFACEILAVSDRTVPNTNLVTKSFSLSFTAKDSTDGIREDEVKSDRLRLKLAAGVTVQDIEAALATEQQQEKEKDVDLDTGMGEWSTVQVTEINEEEEAERARVAEEAAEEARRIVQKPVETKVLPDEPETGDSALGAYNPYNTSGSAMYRGVELSTRGAAKTVEEEAHANFLKKTASSGNVSFKKKQPSNRKRRKMEKLE